MFKNNLYLHETLVRIKYKNRSKNGKNEDL